MRTLGAKLLLAVALPVSVAALAGLAVMWRQTDAAMREATQSQALQLARFIANSFGTIDEAAPKAAPRSAHRAVTSAMRADWSTLTLVSELRIVDGQGVVRWSRRIEEEDRPHAEAPRLAAVTDVTARFSSPGTTWPWSGGVGGEVLLPLGGVACGGCHVGLSTLRTGVLQLTVDEPSLRGSVAHVFRRALSLVVAFALGLTLVLALALHLLLGRPLRRLTADMQRAEAGHILVRADEHDGDEIGRLGHAFNRMLARLTDLKVTEIDNLRDLERAHVELGIKAELEAVNLRLRARLDELQILYENARALASSLELDEVIDRITKELPEHLQVPKFSLMLINDEGRLEIRRASPPALDDGMTFAIGEGICGKAAETLKTIYVSDLEADQRFKPLQGPGARSKGSLLSVPMAHAGELLGVLNFERPDKANFSADEIEFFTAVAGQVAAGVKNARLHQQTVTLSKTDPLTGVPNRRALFEQIQQEMARTQRFQTPLSLVMIDIDYFKKLNDTAGHSAGDDVLRQVAQLLNHNVRRVDTLARYGGEEFAVLLPQIGRKEAVEVAEKLRAAVEALESPYAGTQPLGRLTISSGVASVPEDASSQAALIDAADAALYASKRAGRNKVTAFESGMEHHPGRERGPAAQAPAATTR